MAKKSLETIKLESSYLNGVLPEELHDEADRFSEAGRQILKFHGVYQQHDRDIRGRRNRQYSFMIRSRLPGGQLNAEQYLVHDALADDFGQGNFRLTTRQAIQLHGVIKGELQSTMQSLNKALVTTLAACGDVARNVMCCPTPTGDKIQKQIEAVAKQIADHLLPRTNSYHEIWLIDEEGKKERQHFDSNGTGSNGTGAEEPIYGKKYLPRKFKVAVAPPGDNCTDLLTNDIGLVALADDEDRVHGFNVYVGGGMGQTHNKPETFPRLADALGYVPAEHIVDVVEKIVLVQRDHGDREDRRHARMKYLIHDWGLERFQDTLESYLGYEVEPPRPMPELHYHDHLGWHLQEDGRWYLGLYIENGRVQDAGSRQLRSGLRHIIGKFRPDLRVTPQQNLLLAGIEEEDKEEIEQILEAYGVPLVTDLSALRRNAMACPALPTCGLAITESERYLPDLITELEEEVAGLGLDDEAISIRMTGCPNGCARPYVADIGLVGQSLDKYAVYLGGNLEGTRMNYLYRDLVHSDELRDVLRTILATYKNQRKSQERFGDWAARVGAEKIEKTSLDPALT